jgi:hypothetical protein
MVFTAQKSPLQNHLTLEVKVFIGGFNFKDEISVFIGLFSIGLADNQIEEKFIFKVVLVYHKPPKSKKGQPKIPKPGIPGCPF